MRKSRAAYLSSLETLRIDSPAAFWRLLKPPKQPLAVEPAALHTHYDALFAHPAPTYLPERFLPPGYASPASITPAEVRHAAHLLRHNKALGDSWL